MMKQAIVLQNTVKKTDEECQPVLDEVTAVEPSIEILRRHARAGSLYPGHVLVPELQKFHVMLLQCMSVKCSIHNISDCGTI